MHLRTLLAIAAAMLLLLAACGSPPTAEEPAAADPPAGDADAGADASGDDADADAGTDASADEPAESAALDDEIAQEVAGQLEDALAELDGLEGEERRARLIEMALEEEEQAERPFTSYTSLTLEDLQIVYDAFEEHTGIEADVYRAQPPEVATRLEQEANAGYRGADLIELNALEMATLSAQGVLAPFDTPVTDEVLEGSYTEDWVSRYLLLIVAGWNTEAITGDEIPTSWEEVLSNYPGRLGWEPALVAWFVTLVNDYFMAELGMTEEEAIQVFRDAAEGGVTQTASLVQASELLSAGEFDVAATLFSHQLEARIADGAPVTWNDPAPVEPIVVRSQGTGIYAYAQRPVTALLWVEWMLTDGQVLMVDRGRIPVRDDVEVPGGLPYAGYEVVHERLDILRDPEQLEYWQDIWQDIVER